MSETIHNRIAMLRAERSISRRQLAEALGVHYQTIGYLERGEYSPSLYLALRIAEYFEVPVEVVFSTTPFPRRPPRTKSALGPSGRSQEVRAAEATTPRSAGMATSGIGAADWPRRPETDDLAVTSGQRRRRLRSWCGSGGKPRRRRTGVRPAVRAARGRCRAGTGCRLPPRTA